MVTIQQCPDVHCQHNYDLHLSLGDQELLSSASCVALGNSFLGVGSIGGANSLNSNCKWGIAIV